MDSSAATVGAVFDLEPDFRLPPLAGLDGGDGPDGGQRPVEVATTESEIVYVDTAGRELQRLGIRLSRHSGEEPPGWLLELPSEDAPVRVATSEETVPATVAEALRGVVGDAELTPVLSVTRKATCHRVPGAPGIPALEVVDARHEAATMGIESTIAGWRLAELTATPQHAGEFARLAERLQEAGATKATGSHLDVLLSLGGAADHVSDFDQVADLVSSYVAEQVNAVLLGDIGLRLHRPVIHRTRVALRRLRSILRVCGNLLDGEQAAQLDEELRWLAMVLGEARDAEVLGGRLAEHVAELAPEDVLGPVASRIATEIAAQQAAAMSKVGEAMAADRYVAVLQTLRAWRDGPPLAPEAAVPVAEIAANVKHARDRFRSRLRKALDEPPTSLHRARKAAKRLRYVAEMAAPVLGSGTEKTAAKAKSIQTKLGEYQDASVSAAFLRRLGADAGTTPGHNGFTYGLLTGNERARAVRIERKIRKRIGR